VAYPSYGEPYGERDRTPLPPMPPSWQTQPPFPVPAPAPPVAGAPTSAIPYPGLPQSAPPAYGTAPFDYVDPLSGQQLSDKSKLTAGLLQLFLGAFGAGRFYTGHSDLAMGQIAVGWTVLALLGCSGMLLGVPLLFCWIGFMWPLVDGIMILTGRPRDSDGRYLRD
jgi:TM2 domain-containing membrane protein YozV